MSMRKGCRRQIYGLDFSAARRAGKKIWVAAGRVRAGALHIERCAPLAAYTGTGPELQEALAGLRDFVSGHPDALFGFDFPFGLSARLAAGCADWEDFVLNFPARYADPHQFRQRCLAEAEGREIKRHTDEASRAPWSPYNLRLYRQTYWGVSGLLSPWVRTRTACVLPMQIPLPGRAWVVEVCPASTLRSLGLYRRYKRRDEAGCAVRAAVLAGLEAGRELVVASGEVRRLVARDAAGDALDSVVAAFAAWRALRRPSLLTVTKSSAYALEGYIYV